MLILGLTIHAWITLLVLAAVLIILIRTNLPPDMVFLVAVGVLMLTGTVDTKTALSGFSSEAVVRVGVLFVVASGLYWTGCLKWAVEHVMSFPKTYMQGLLKMTLPTAMLSSLMSDTSVVIIFTKIMKMWAKKLGIASSKMLIPLTHIAEMGGILTVISCTPNIVISALYAASSGEQMNIFIITPAAVICLMVTLGVILLMARFLPSRVSPDDTFENEKEYTMELTVPANSNLVGKTLEDCGLLNVDGGHLVELIRFDKEIISPVAPDDFLMGGDRLVFSGDIQKIGKLKNTYHLAIADKPVFSLKEDQAKDRKTCSATVRFNSSLIGKRISETDFEKANDVVLIAISREGQRIPGSPRETKIKGGDTLLLGYSSKSSEVFNRLKNEVVWIENEDLITTSHKTIIATAILAVMVLVIATEWLSILEGTVLAAIAMLAFKCCSMKEAQKSVRWDIIMMYASSIVIGAAIEQNGIAKALIEGVLNISGDNTLLMMTLIAASAMLLTEFINNATVAALFYPVVHQASMATGVSLQAMCLLLMLTASMSFATPIGTPINTVVYGPGGYKFSDYLIIGVPLKIVLLITSVATIYLLYM